MRATPIREKRARRRVLLAALAVAGVSILIGSRAEADINFYRLGKRIAYNQTTDSPPTTPVSMDGGVDISASNPLDFLSVRVFSTSPTHFSPASPFTLTQFSPGYWGSSQFYPSQSAMDTNLPPGDTFGYLIEGGLLGDRLALLHIPANDLFTSDIPFYTGAAYTTLNGMNTAAPQTITWNGYTPAPGTNSSPIFFNIYRVSDGQSVAGTVVANNVTSYFLPPNTLQPGTQYRADIDYSSRLDVADAGFINGDASLNYDLLTSLTFTTGIGMGGGALLAPEPTSLVLAFAAFLAIASLRTVRRARTAGLLLASIALAMQATPANAAIDFYRFGKTLAYQQTSNSQPTTPTSIYGGVDMFTPAPSDFTSARAFSTTTTPPSPVPEFVLSQVSPGYWLSQQVYSSLSEMDSQLPPGDTFGYLVEGGTLGSQLALLPVPATNLFSPNIPYFTGNAFSQLNDMDTRLPFTLNWNTFALAPGVNNAPIFFNVYRVSDGQSMAGGTLSSSTTSFLIPANTLSPHTQYKANIDFSSRQDTTDAGFTTADSSANYDSVTELVFTPPTFAAGDYNRDHRVDAADYVLWRKTLGQTGLVAFSGADGDGDGNILATDYNVWRANFGTVASGSGLLSSAVPEPSATILVICGLTVTLAVKRRRNVQSW